MESFTRVTGLAVPMLRANIDTDQLVPGTEAVRSRKEGYGPSLFANLRYVGDREPNPDFILNQKPWDSASILLADQNFGCGSSRESAPKALREFGFRSVIAPSFGGIFFNNCFRNGLLLVEMPIECIRSIATEMERAPQKALVTVDLEAQTVSGEGLEIFTFKTPGLMRQMLLEGIDEIDATLRRRSEIEQYRKPDRQARPWAY